MSADTALTPDEFDAIQNAIFDLDRDWNIFLYFFGKGPQRVSLLNDFSSHFFGLFHTLLCERLAIAACRLTDPPTYKRKKNEVFRRSTIRQLQPLVTPDDGGKPKRAPLPHHINIARERLDKWRNNHYAHADLDAAISLDRISNSIHYDDITTILGYAHELTREYQDRNGLPHSSCAHQDDLILANFLRKLVLGQHAFVAREEEIRTTQNRSLIIELP